MSYIQRLSIQQRRGKRFTHFQDQEKQSLRQTLMERATKLKQKIAQQTNTFDFSVQKLMNQTLRQVQKHKHDFQQKHDDLTHVYQGEQYERKKTLLKQQLHRKLQICKNRYKQKISLIKNKKCRFYTSNSKSNQQKISIEDMLKTAKNRFKFEKKDTVNKQRNKSQIIQLKKINQKQIINFVNKNYPGKCAVKFKSGIKQDYDQISIDMIKGKKSKNLESSASMEKVGSNELSPQKLHATQMISMPSQQSRKSLLQNLRNKRKLYPSGYSKFNQSQNPNVQNLSNSQRSIFIPMGKVALSNQRKRMMTDFQVTNSHKREKNHRANKLSSEIVAEFVEIQMSENNEKQIKKVYLPLNKKLKTDTSIHLKDKSIRVQLLTPIRTSRADNNEMQSPQTNLIRSLKFQKMNPKSKYFQNQNQDENEDEESNQKQLNEIQCMININDLKVDRSNDKQRDRQVLIKNGQNSGLKSILYNRKVNQLSRKMMRNHLNSRIPPKKHLMSQFSSPCDSKVGSRSMLLDIKGSNMRLQKSVTKGQKLRQEEYLQRQ